MLEYVENKWIESIEEVYYSKENILFKDMTIYFNLDTPVSEILKYTNHSKATLAVLTPLDDKDYKNFDEIGFHIVVDGELEVIYKSDKELPVIWLQYDSNGQRFKNINGELDEELTKFLLSIDSNIFNEEQGEM